MATAELRLTARDETQAAVNSALAGLNRMEGGVGRLKGLFTSALGSLGLGLGMQEILKQTVEVERTQARLEAVLKSTGYAAGLTTVQIEDLAQSLKAATTFDDDALKAGLVSLLRFRDIGGDAFRQFAVLATDLATVMNSDLASAFQTVGRLGQEPTESLKGLRAAGFELSDSEIELAKNLEAVGDKAGAQKIAIDALTRAIGGSAAAEAGGLYGGLRDVTRAWGDLEKSIGRTPWVLDTAIEGFHFLKKALADVQAVIDAPWTEKLQTAWLGADSVAWARNARQAGASGSWGPTQAEERAAAGRQAREDELLWEQALAGDERIGKWLDDQARKRASAARDATSEAKRIAAEQKRLHDQALQDSVQVFERQLEAEEEFQRDSAQAWDIYTQNVIAIRRHAMQDEAEWFGVGDLERFREAGSGTRGWGEGTRFGTEIKDAADKTERLSDTARELGLTFQSAFEDAVIAGKDFSDVLQGIEKDLLRVAARRLVTEPLVNAGSEIFSGMGEAIRRMLPGFASGGSFTVGGAGGVDSKLVAFMATPGEHVSVSTPGQSGGGTVINQTFNVSTTTGAVGGGPADARELARAMAGEVKAIMIQELRPGGLLAR